MSRAWEKYKEALEGESADLTKGDKRSLRRGNTERKHNQRAKYISKWFQHTPPDDRLFSIALETPKRGSSCRCCSNPRKSGKGKDRLTLQERRLGVTYNEELE